MKTDVLKYLEFFAEEFGRVDSKRFSASDDDQLPRDSFFRDVDDFCEEIVSLDTLLNGHEIFLGTVAKGWEGESLPGSHLPISLDSFIRENVEDLNRPEMKVRTILDYVYTVV